MGLPKSRPRLAGSVSVVLGSIFVVTACAGGGDAPGEVPFDRLDIVARWRLEPQSEAGDYVSTEDIAGVWVEAFLEPDRGWGIFRAEGETRVFVPDSDAGELYFDDFRLRLTTDDYTQSGWLRGAHLVFQGAGRASFEERGDEYGSRWLVSGASRSEYAAELSGGLGAQVQLTGDLVK